MTEDRRVSGRYLLKEKIVSTGFSTIHRAMDERTKKEMALKLSDEPIQESAHLERYRMVAKKLSEIKHANVPGVFDMGTDDGRFFMAMEILGGGQHLLNILKENGRMPWGEAKPIAEQVCDGLQACHDNGLWHMDVKPGNILVMEGGLVKILPSGSCRFAEGEPNDSLMRTGMISGTFKYMAPEQTRGTPSDIDHRADIYALGVTMYEMLSGDVPFKGDNLFDLLERIKAVAPLPLSQKCPELGIPAVVEAVVMKALAKNPDERFQTMREMRQAISGA